MGKIAQPTALVREYRPATEVLQLAGKPRPKEGGHGRERPD
jgi:hypothetical protein